MDRPTPDETGSVGRSEINMVRRGRSLETRVKAIAEGHITLHGEAQPHRN